MYCFKTPIFDQFNYALIVFYFIAISLLFNYCLIITYLILRLFGHGPIEKIKANNFPKVLGMKGKQKTKQVIFEKSWGWDVNKKQKNRENQNKKQIFQKSLGWGGEQKTKKKIKQNVWSSSNKLFFGFPSVFFLVFVVNLLVFLPKKHFVVKNKNIIIFLGVTKNKRFPRKTNNPKTKQNVWSTSKKLFFLFSLIFLVLLVFLAKSWFLMKKDNCPTTALVFHHKTKNSRNILLVDEKQKHRDNQQNGKKNTLKENQKNILFEVDQAFCLFFLGLVLVFLGKSLGLLHIYHVTVCDLLVFSYFLFKKYT